MALTAESGLSSFLIVPAGSGSAPKSGALPWSTKTACMACASTSWSLHTASLCSCTAAHEIELREQMDRLAGIQMRMLLGGADGAQMKKLPRPLCIAVCHRRVQKQH